MSFIFVVFVLCLFRKKKCEFHLYQLSSILPLCKGYCTRVLLCLSTLYLPFHTGQQTELYKWFIFSTIYLFCHYSTAHFCMHSTPRYRHCFTTSRTCQRRPPFCIAMEKMVAFSGLVPRCLFSSWMSAPALRREKRAAVQRQKTKENQCNL